jgi:hypothetical protein
MTVLAIFGGAFTGKFEPNGEKENHHEAIGKYLACSGKDSLR